MILECSNEVGQAPGALGVTENGNDGFQLAGLGGAAEFEQAVLANESLAGPGAVADKVDATRSRSQGEFG